MLAFMFYMAVFCIICFVAGVIYEIVEFFNW
jgi:hypothetical protein